MSGPPASEPVADRHLDRAARVVDGRQVAAVVLVEDVADAEVHAGAVEPLVVGPPSHEQVMDGIAGGGIDPVGNAVLLSGGPHAPPGLEFERRDAAAARPGALFAGAVVQRESAERLVGIVCVCSCYICLSP